MALMGNNIFSGKKLGNKIGKLILVMTKHCLHMKEKKQVGDDEKNQVADNGKNQIADNGPTFVCDFCLQSIHLKKSFNIKGCFHFYCQECIVKYVVSSLQNNVTSIMCPSRGCTGMLDPDYCRPILSNEVFHRWVDALCESLLDSENHIDSSFTCDFCVEPVDLKDSFNIKDCAHFYCQECIVKFVVSKLDDNVTSIVCPVQGCSGVLDLEYCRPVLPYDVFNRWGKALCESAVMGPHQKYIYCPYNECSVLLIDEEPEDTNQAQCPHCKREFCAKCKVPWHTEFDCAKFQKLRDTGEDKMLEELAKNKNWRRCPSCKYYVERKDGCSYIKCRCGYAFCYSCGITAPLDHHTMRCPSCKQ